MKKINIACIGCGWIAVNQHLKNIAGIPEISLKATVDIRENIAKECCNRFGAEYYTTDVDKVLSDSGIDAVLICTNSESHVPLAIKAAQAGKDIFVEKPLGLTTEECKRLEKKLHSNGIKLMVGFCYRFNPVVERVKLLIQNPVFSFAHVMTGKTSVGNEEFIIDNMCHASDMLCWLHNSEPEKIYAVGNNTENGKFDKVAVTIKFKNGSAGCLIIGKDASAGYLPKWVYKICGDDGINAEIVNYQEVRFQPDKSKDMKSEDYYYQGHLKELGIFAGCILKDVEPPVTVRDGIRAVEFQERVFKSLKEEEVQE